ncbi:MAG: ComF family protein, partial [Desulfatitalea sp.]|nr:ComF family protein [Desulfatitalea sp.]
MIRVARAALEAVLPAVCSDCGQLFRLAAGTPVRPAAPAAVDDWFRFLLRPHLCPGCMQRFKAVASPMCPRCGEPFVSPHGLDHLCGICQAQPPRFMAARSVGHYEGPLRALIHHYKYLGRERLGEPLGRLLWEVLRRDWEPENIDRVLPVPLHPRRMRQRGFNQAHTLIRLWPALARASGVRVAKHWVDARVLTRCRPTPPQTGLTKTQRADNLTRAF